MAWESDAEPLHKFFHRGELGEFEGDGSGREGSPRSLPKSVEKYVCQHSRSVFRQLAAGIRRSGFLPDELSNLTISRRRSSDTRQRMNRGSGDQGEKGKERRVEADASLQ